MGKKDYNRKDHFYLKAKAEGYRSRAAYKLLELDKEHNLLKPRAKVIELGAWPGGWLQIAAESVGPDGLVVGIDLVQIEDLGIDNIRTICGDVDEQENIDSALALAPDKYDVVLSDMAPKLSGIKEADRYATVGVAESGFHAAKNLMKIGGHFVCKVFKSSETDKFVRDLRKYFTKVWREELESTRKSSNEFYIVGTAYKGT